MINDDDSAPTSMIDRPAHLSPSELGRRSPAYLGLFAHFEAAWLEAKRAHRSAAARAQVEPN